MRAASTTMPSAIALACSSAPCVSTNACGSASSFGLPRPGGALVVGRHGAVHHRHQRLHGARGGQDVFTGDRVALLRHGGRGTAAGDVGFRHFGDLGLRQQDDVGGELRQAAADQARGSATVSAKPSRQTCQGAGGAARPSSAASAFHHRDALVAERGQRAGGAAEAAPARRAGGAASSRCTCATSGCAQMAHFSPKRDRQRLLQMGAPGHHGVRGASRPGPPAPPRCRRARCGSAPGPRAPAARWRCP